MKRILLVEADLTVGQVFSEIVDDRAFFIHASSNREARKLIEVSRRFDAIFFAGKAADGLTTESGIIPLAKAKFPHCLLIAISASVNDIQIAQGCTLSCPKPIPGRDLNNLVGEVCGELEAATA